MNKQVANAPKDDPLPARDEAAQSSELRKKLQFMEQMLSAYQRDRQLMAYEIHDTFLQDVIAALMFIDAAYDLRRTAGEQDLEGLERARTLLRKSIDEARRMISGLRPPIIDEQGIVARIENLASEMRSRGLQVHFAHAIDRQHFEPIVESTIFRIVHEALTNVERHSKSREAHVSLTQIGETIRLEIRDFGVGFDPEAIAEGHYGLLGIKERARLIGAAASITSARGEGTVMVVEVPLSNAPH
jgi:signal transduction histidine kinase